MSEGLKMTDLHGAMEVCPRCKSKQATEIRTLYSEKIDYHVDIFKCDNCDAYLISSFWLEHSELEAYNTLEEALEDAKERIEIQELILEEET